MITGKELGFPVDISNRRRGLEEIMENNAKSSGYSNGKATLKALGLCLAGLAINLVGSRIALTLKLPFFLDCIGTILASALGGYIPGIAAGFLTNLINSLADPVTAYYGVLNVGIAVCVSFYAEKDRFKSFKYFGLIAGTLALLGGGVGSVLTWFLYGGGIGEGISAPMAHMLYDNGVMNMFLSQFTADMVIDMADKAVSVLIAMLALKAIPKPVQEELYYRLWQQTPLTREQRRKVERKMSRGFSLRFKLLMILGAATIIIAVVVTGISFQQYRNANIEEQKEMARGVCFVAKANIDPEMVDEYLEKGEAVPGYLETKERIQALMDSTDEIAFVYVYRIEPDGCHVVFDPDSPDLPGEAPGTVVPFDEAFMDDLPRLLAGERIEPIISDETYGWLLTVYEPIYNSEGRCVCYAAADISMDKIRENERLFMVRVLSLFLGFFILILGISLWLAEYYITVPINSMAITAGHFAYNTDSAREGSLETIRGLNIHTGDEIENLYHAITKTTEDTVRYIAEDQKKKETISHFQNGLIMVLADLVESRDKCTGDHVRKTAAYARVIMEQMRREGLYTDILTDEYIQDVVESAPLHDVGKIEVPDAILNKPGKLTDEEFALMKKHAADGAEILENAISTIAGDDTAYLKEACNLAHYHHEKWNGTGYPEGLKGTEIPLSARIMAVADVFDALVSDRSYKKGFSIEKSLDIIREGKGTHFDPDVAQAFLDAEDEVRKVAARNERETALKKLKS